MLPFSALTTKMRKIGDSANQLNSGKCIKKKEKHIV